MGLEIGEHLVVNSCSHLNCALLLVLFSVVLLVVVFVHIIGCEYVHVTCVQT